MNLVSSYLTGKGERGSRQQREEKDKNKTRKREEIEY